jgi:acyl dehydratase
MGGMRSAAPLRGPGDANQGDTSVSNDIKMPVEATHILMFARAIGDDNPIYRDPEYAAKTEVGGIIAPPTFPRAVSQFDPDYPMRLKPGQKWFGSGKNPSGLDGPAPTSGGLHAEQHFEYHRQLRPGDQLTVTTKEGAKWEKESKRAGKLKFQERIQEYRDQKGELVITSRAVSVRTERPVEQS